MLHEVQNEVQDEKLYRMPSYLHVLDKILAQSYLQFSDVALCLEMNRIKISISISLITHILLDIKI